MADAYLDAYCALDPCQATGIGVVSYDDQLTDFSPAGHAGRATLARSTLAAAERALSESDADPLPRERVAAAQLSERLNADLELYDRGVTERDINVLASPMQQIRETFSLMPTDTPADWEVIGARMNQVRSSLQGFTESLRRSAAAGRVSARRQVEICARRACTSQFFETLAEGSGLDQVRRVAADADSAYAEFGNFLATELAPMAPIEDAVGRDDYEACFGFHIGAALDLEETYRWGIAEVGRIVDEQQRVAKAIVPNGTVTDAVAHLNADPARRVAGIDGLRGWLQETSDRSVAELADVHFDIPDPVRRLECMIAPPGANSGAYYSPASEDFSRPGRMWWSVPAGETSFATWAEKSTVFHEGVPGHHLQFGQTAYRSESLNRYQRLMCWVPGHGEGWALYAERLMDELGYLADPGDKLGMLDGQLLRAVRVVIDIGMHLQLRIPAGTGWNDGATWTPDLGWDFLRLHSTMPDSAVTDERNRYLGFPGQAPAYKVGERVWLQARADAEVRHGSQFNLLQWHRAALDLGSMGLDPLRRELALI